MNELFPGMLVMTKRKTGYPEIWVRIEEPEDFITHECIGSLNDLKKDALYLYIGQLKEDKRFAEILLGDRKVAVKYKALEKL